MTETRLKLASNMFGAFLTGWLSAIFLADGIYDLSIVFCALSALITFDTVFPNARKHAPIRLSLIGFVILVLLPGFLANMI